MMEMNITKRNEHQSPKKAEQNHYLLHWEKGPVASILGPHPYTEGLCICPFDLSICLMDLLKIILFVGWHGKAAATNYAKKP